MKVHLLDRCEFCDGEAYIFDCQDIDARGEALELYQIDMIPLFILLKISKG